MNNHKFNPTGGDWRGTEQLSSDSFHFLGQQRNRDTTPKWQALPRATGRMHVPLSCWQLFNPKICKSEPTLPLLLRAWGYPRVPHFPEIWGWWEPTAPSKENTKNQINASHMVPSREYPIIPHREHRFCVAECETQILSKYSIPESLSNLRKQLRGKKGKGLAALPGHCSSWELPGAKEPPGTILSLSMWQWRAANTLKPKPRWGSKLGKARTPQRAPGQSPQSLRSGLAQAFQTLLKH